MGFSISKLTDTSILEHISFDFKCSTHAALDKSLNEECQRPGAQSRSGIVRAALKVGTAYRSGPVRFEPLAASPGRELKKQ